MSPPSHDDGVPHCQFFEMPQVFGDMPWKPALRPDDIVLRRCHDQRDPHVATGMRPMAGCGW